MLASGVVLLILGIWYWIILGFIACCGCGCGDYGPTTVVVEQPLIQPQQQYQIQQLQPQPQQSQTVVTVAPSSNPPPQPAPVQQMQVQGGKLNGGKGRDEPKAGGAGTLKGGNGGDGPTGGASQTGATSERTTQQTLQDRDISKSDFYDQNDAESQESLNPDMVKDSSNRSSQVGSESEEEGEEKVNIHGQAKKDKAKPQSKSK